MEISQIYFSQAAIYEVYLINKVHSPCLDFHHELLINISTTVCSTRNIFKDNYLCIKAKKGPNLRHCHSVLLSVSKRKLLCIYLG